MTDDNETDHGGNEHERLMSTVSPVALRPTSSCTAPGGGRTPAEEVAALMCLPRAKRRLARGKKNKESKKLRRSPAPSDPRNWMTPKRFIDRVLGALDVKKFCIDVASPGPRRSHVPAVLYFTKDDPAGHGLERRWRGKRVWCNPPYDNIPEWVAKADEAVRNGDSGMVVALLPNQADAAWYHDHVARRAHVFLLRGRVRFMASRKVFGASPKFGSLLVVWGGTPEEIARMRDEFATAHFVPGEGWPGEVIGQRDATPTPDDPAAAGVEGAPRDLRSIDLFCGGGSVHLAMEAAGLTTVLANDWCADKRDTFSLNFPQVRLDRRNIEDIRGHELPWADVVTGSPPCSDHSSDGKRLGYAGERGIMAFEIVRLVREMRVLGRAPGVVVIENVLGLLDHGDGRDFAALVEALMTEGYDVGALVVDARLFLPQSRRRVFIVAVRAGVELPPGLEAGRPTRRWHPTLLRRAHAALSAGARRSWHWWTLPVPQDRVPALADLLEPSAAINKWMGEGFVAKVASLLPPKEQAKVERARAAGIGVGIVKERRQGKGLAQVRYYEVFFDGLARCLQKCEGGNHQRVVILDEGAPKGLRIREFTPREGARLTGLPDHYELPVPVRSRRLTGDAVVVPAYEWLARHLARPLAEAAAVPRGVHEAAEAQVSDEAAPDASREERDGMGHVILNPGANRPSKLVSKRTEVPNLLQAHLAIEEHAAEEGVSMADLYRRAMDCYRASRGKPALPKYVPLARTPELRPKAVRKGAAGRRARVAGEGAGGNKAGKADIATLRRQPFPALPFPARRLCRPGVLHVALRPGTCRAFFPRSVTLAARGGSRPTWHAGPQAAAR